MKKIAAVVIFAALGLGAAIADTHEDRETLMKQNGGALKALNGAGQATPFDPAAAKAPTQTLIDNAAKIPALFAPGTDTIDQGALPAVWSDQAGFKASAAKLGTDAQALQAATDQAGFAVALKTVQGDCASCHGTYRAKPAPKPAAQ
jgi:cytochrome c556